MVSGMGLEEWAGGQGQWTLICLLGILVFKNHGKANELVRAEIMGKILVKGKTHQGWLSCVSICTPRQIKVLFCAVGKAGGRAGILCVCVWGGIQIINFFFTMLSSELPLNLSCLIV